VDVCKGDGVPVSSFTGTVYLTTKPHTVPGGAQDTM
jgi:hypothetical protein